MKNNFTISQRNAIVENHLWCIKAVMKQNRALIRAVMSFDPEKGNLEQHIFAQLHFELLNCKHPYRLHGMTGMPAESRGNVISLDAYRMRDAA